MAWLLYYKYFKLNLQLIATDLSRQKALKTNLIIYYIFEQSKETILEFYKGTAKVV